MLCLSRGKIRGDIEIFRELGFGFDCYPIGLLSNKSDLVYLFQRPSLININNDFYIRNEHMLANSCLYASVKYERLHMLFLAQVYAYRAPFSLLANKASNFSISCFSDQFLSISTASKIIPFLCNSSFLAYLGTSHSLGEVSKITSCAYCNYA